MIFCFFSILDWSDKQKSQSLSQSFANRDHNTSKTTWSYLVTQGRWRHENNFACSLSLRLSGLRYRHHSSGHRSMAELHLLDLQRGHHWWQNLLPDRWRVSNVCCFVYAVGMQYHITCKRMPQLWRHDDTFLSVSVNRTYQTVFCLLRQGCFLQWLCENLHLVMIYYFFNIKLHLLTFCFTKLMLIIELSAEWLNRTRTT